MGRWEHLYDRKPVPLVEQFVEEVAKILARELLTWPPPLEGWEQEEAKTRFAPLFAQGAPRPKAEVFRGAFELARWEMRREVDRIDAFMRAEGWRQYAVPGYEYEALIFLSRWLTEQMLDAAEATSGKIQRPQLVDCLDRTERLLAQLRANVQ